MIVEIYFKTKYERLYQKDVEDVKRAFSVPQQSEPTEGDTESELESIDTLDPTPEEIINYNSIISAQGYGESAIPVDSEKKEVKGVPRPYVISPAEFDTLDDYEVFSLNYFEDGVLADIAPTMLHILGLEQPKEMTGKSLIK